MSGQPGSDAPLRGGVVVTGGAQGLGQAICLRLAADGYRVVSVDLQAGAAAPRTYRSITGDAGDVAVLHEACAVAAANGAGLVGFVANAGINRWAAATELARSDWDAVMAVDLTAVFEGARVAAKHFGGGGSVVVVSSVAGLLGLPVRAAYCASKAGSLGLVRALATEWGPQQIRVNGVAPGVIETLLIKQSREQGAMASAETMSGSIPLRRLGDPDDVAAVVAFLLSSESGYVTGVTVPVDGGLSNMLAPLTG